MTKLQRRRESKSVQEKIQLDTQGVTMRGRADVSGHAGPAFPCPAVCSHTDSVLGVHLQVAHVHVLEKNAMGIEKKSDKGEICMSIFSLRESLM